MKKVKYLIFLALALYIIGFGVWYFITYREEMIKEYQAKIEAKLESRQTRLIEKAEKEYAKLLLDHQDDFEYVVNAIEQSNIDVDFVLSLENGIVSNSREVDEIIANDEALQYHLDQLHELGEIDKIVGVTSDFDKQYMIVFYTTTGRFWTGELIYEKGHAKYFSKKYRYMVNEDWVVEVLYKGRI